MSGSSARPDRGARLHPLAAAFRWPIFAVQAALAVRVFARMARTMRGERIERIAAAPGGERAVVIVPVLDEEARLEPCLAGLNLQGPELAAVFVVDGGSRDGTLDLARAWAARDARVGVVEAGPAAAGSNGKVHNLARGLAAADEVPDARWLLTIDADVRPAPGLIAALLAHASRSGLSVLSAATQQRLSGSVEALVHPSLLATLVYRFGVPGLATADPTRVQANGQCMLLRRDVLARAGGFAPLAGEIAEDVALARRIAALGEPVGFFETDGLVSAEMYAGAREALVNWSRSLPMVEGQPLWRTALGLAEVVLVQAAPLLMAAVAMADHALSRKPAALPSSRACRGISSREERTDDAPNVGGRDEIPRQARDDVVNGLHAASRGAADVNGDRKVNSAVWLRRLNVVLLAARIGTLAGMARAYPEQPAAYWLSPATDGVAAAALLLRAIRRRHVWRGRTVVRGGGRAR